MPALCWRPHCGQHLCTGAAPAVGQAAEQVGLRKPWKGILPASLSRGAEYSASCIACPASRKRGSSHCVILLLVLNTISLRSKLTAKALLLSPAQPRGVFTKTNNTESSPTCKLQMGLLFQT